MGMKVLLTTEDADLNPKELTNEEKVAWLESLVQQSKRCMKDLEGEHKLIKDYLARSNKLVDGLNGIIKAAKEDPEFDSIGALRHLNRQVSDTKGYKWLRTRLLTPVQVPSLLYDEVEEVNCGCLVAQKGENTLRYLDFEGDPVVTISGPDTENIRKTLKKRL